MSINCSAEVGATKRQLIFRFVQIRKVREAVDQRKSHLYRDGNLPRRSINDGSSRTCRRCLGRSSNRSHREVHSAGTIERLPWPRARSNSCFGNAPGNAKRESKCGVIRRPVGCPVSAPRNLQQISEATRVGRTNPLMF